MPLTGGAYRSRGDIPFLAPERPGCSGFPGRSTALRSRPLRLVLAAGFARRRQVAVSDQTLRPGGVQGGIVRSDGGQPVDIPVEHTEHCRDKNGVVDLQVGRACVRVRATRLAVTSCPLRRAAAAIASKAFSLAGTGALLASERTCSTTAMPPGSWAAAHAACDAEQYRHSFSTDT
jgi:hypothetical protein